VASDVLLDVVFGVLAILVTAATQWICPAWWAPLPPGWIQGNTGANPTSRTASSSAHTPGFTNLNDIPPNGVWISALLSPRRPTSPAPSRHRPLRLPLSLRYPNQIAKPEGSSLPEYRFAGRYRGIYFVDVRVASVVESRRGRCASVRRPFSGIYDYLSSSPRQRAVTSTSRSTEM
jgi:hypothetical protein